MILKIKKRDLVFLVSSLLIAIPIIIAGLLVVAPGALGAVNRSFFVVELTVGGRTPSVFYVNWSVTTASGNLVDGGKAIFSFTFNTSDGDGYDDLDYTKIVINVSLGEDLGQQFFNSSCNYTVYNTNFTWFNCTIAFDYWANASSNWVINVSVTDDGSLTAFNDTMRFTVNSLTAMRLVSTAVNFSSGATAGANNVAAATNPFVINNTGNFDFSKINITGQNLAGVTNPAQVITPGNITVNTTDYSGIPMLQGQSVTIPSANLTHGAPGVGNLSLYFYIDVPAGMQAQVYNVTYPWEITLE